MILKNKNIFIYIISITSSIVGILLNFFLARFLEAESYGRLQYFVSLATLISNILLLGINTFIVREAKNEKQNGQLINKCLSLYSTIIIGSFPIALFVLFKFVDKTQSNWFFTITTLIFACLIGFVSIISAWYQGNGKYHISIVFENLIPKFSMLLLLFIFFSISKLSFYENYYLLFYIVVYFLVVIIFIIKNFKKICFCFQKSEIKSIFFFFGVTITYSLGTNLTKVIQGGLYNNDVALATISISVSIISLIKIFTSVLDNIVKPLFAKQKREKDINEILNTYRFDTRVNLYVAIPLYIYFIIHSEMFLSIFGTSYLEYPGILKILSLAYAVSTLTGPNGTMLAMIGKEKYELINGLIYFTTYIGSVFLFSNDRVYGLCFAMLLAESVVNVCKYLETWILFKSSPLDLKSIITILLIILVNTALIYPLKFIRNFWLWLAVGLPAGIIMVFLNFFVISLYRKKDFSKLLNVGV